MISPKELIDYFIECSLTFYSGVPDSLTFKLCNFIEDFAKVDNSPITFLPAAHEGIAVSFAIGNFLATGRPGIVFMQNAGLGNTVNPIVSIADKEVFNIPIILLVGWRGHPGTQDEPQHSLQGRITQTLLSEMGFKTIILNKEWDVNKIRKLNIFEELQEHSLKIAFLFERGAV